MNTEDKTPEPEDRQTPPPGTHKVTDLDTGEVNYEPDKPENEAGFDMDDEEMMDFGSGSGGGSGGDGAAA